ncbi:hypothetical protein ACWDBD_47910 [Streptomyces sp. NPDC001118]
MPSVGPRRSPAVDSLLRRAAVRRQRRDHRPAPAESHRAAAGRPTGPRATAYDQGRPALIPLIPLIALICATDADPGWVPGQRVAHLGHAGYLLIAEIIARRSGTAFAEFL